MFPHSPYFYIWILALEDCICMSVYILGIEWLHQYCRPCMFRLRFVVNSGFTVVFQQAGCSHFFQWPMGIGN